MKPPKQVTEQQAQQKDQKRITRKRQEQKHKEKED